MQIVSMYYIEIVIKYYNKLAFSSNQPKTAKVPSVCALILFLLYCESIASHYLLGASSR